MSLFPWRRPRTADRAKFHGPLIRCAVLSLLITVASSSAWAQTYYQLNQAGSITFGNTTFTLGSCGYQLNNGASTNCNNDDIEISVTTARHSITINYVNSVSPGSPLLSQATSNGCTCIQFELTVANAGGLSSASVSSTGYGKAGTSLDDWVETYGSGTKLAQAQISTNGYQTVSSTWTTTGNPTSLNLELGLGVNAAYQAGVVSLTGGSVSFATAPEPATITLLLTGIGGLAVARSRRRRRA